MKPAYVFFSLLLLTACSKAPEGAESLVSCNELPTYEECQAAEHCAWQFSDLDPQTLQIMSPAHCRDLDWVTLDAGEFTILAPEAWQFMPLMGIDSTVGKFSDGEMTLSFDYGFYTGDFMNNSVYSENPSAYLVEELFINGLAAKIYLPKESGSDKPTVLFVKNPRGMGPCTEGVCGLEQENFEMLGDNLTEEEMSVAVQIFKSVDFK